MEGAQDLANHNKLQFEQGCGMRIPHMRPNEKQDDEEGVEGTGCFKAAADHGKVAVAVKGGGNINPAIVRDLAGTMKAAGADLGVWMTLATGWSRRRPFTAL